MASKKGNIIIWGGGLRCLKILNFFKNSKFLKKNNLKVKYVYDKFIKKLDFKNNVFFSNKNSDLDKMIKNSTHFIVAIGSEHGKARYLISENLRKIGLEPLNAINKFSIIDSTSTVGRGLQIEPGSIIQGNCKIGNYCIINTNAAIDHGSVIGDGCHIMTGASVAGRVNVGDFVTIGTNATILPDIKIGSGSYIGAGSVVVKSVKKNTIVVGNPAKKIKSNKHKFDISYFK